MNVVTRNTLNPAQLAPPDTGDDLPTMRAVARGVTAALAASPDATSRSTWTSIVGTHAPGRNGALETTIQVDGITVPSVGYAMPVTFGGLTGADNAPPLPGASDPYATGADNTPAAGTVASDSYGTGADNAPSTGTVATDPYRTGADNAPAAPPLPLAPAPPAAATDGSTAPTTTATTRTTPTTTKTTTSTTSSKSTISAKELAFLDDKKLTIQDKLFLFIALVTKKNDQKLVDAMKEQAGKTPATPSTSSKASTTSVAPAPKTSDSGGGLLGFIGDAVGAVTGAVSGAVGDLLDHPLEAVFPLLAGATAELGGPALAAAVTALGAPELAPAALAAGNAAGATVKALAGAKPNASASKATAKSTSSRSSTATSKSSSSSSSGSSASADGAADEQLQVLNIQRLQEAQTVMFTALTNVMRSLHDAQMAAVQNIR